MADSAFGTIEVFGSAELQTEPDRAVLSFTVSRRAAEPDAAFAAARSASAAVLDHLRNIEVSDVRSSRIQLRQHQEHTGPDRQERTVVYTGVIAHTVTTADLDGVETLIASALGAGANELGSVTFATTQLAELRAQARHAAIEAARAKAQVYADAAQVGLGDVCRIQDLNPDAAPGPTVRRRAKSAGDDGPGTEPGQITVSARATVWFEIL